jgi:hypothetical protein
VKNGHIQTLDMLMKKVDCSQAFKEEAVDFNGNTPLHSLCLNIVSDYREIYLILYLIGVQTGT